MSNKSIQLTDKIYDYLIDHSVREHAVLQKLREDNRHDQLISVMQIAPEQGQFMAFLIKLLGVNRILEIGTSTGYSTLAMALSLPEKGVIDTCDINKIATGKAKQYWKQAGVDSKVNLHLAPALDTLALLLKDKLAASYDMAFLDADKINYDAYYEACLNLIKTNGLIIIDNVLWGGSVADKSINDADTNAIRALNTKLYSDERVEVSMIPVADGLTLVRKI